MCSDRGMKMYLLVRVLAVPDVFKSFRDVWPVGGTAIIHADGSLKHKIIEKGQKMEEKLSQELRREQGTAHQA